MPTALPVFITALYAGESIAIASFIYGATQVFAYAATTLILNGVSKALTPKSPQGDGGGMEINYAGTDMPGVIIAGEITTGGMHVIPPITAGTSNEDLHQVLAIAIHEVDSFQDVYFDDDTITNASIAAVSGSSGDGLVSGGGAGKYADKAWVRRYRGTSSQTVDWHLNNIAPSTFTSSFRGRGITYGAVTFRFDDTVYTSVPQVNFGVRGLRLYDPRLDSTKSGGAGSHRDDDPTTWAYSNNPALFLAHYLMNTAYGGGYQSSEIDWSTVMTAANECDELVNIPGATTQKRYTCNGILLANRDFADNVKTIADSMLGRVIFKDGQWRMYAGGWQTPSFEINQEDFIGPVSIQFEGGRDARFNRVRCWYVDSARKYTRSECFPRSNATYKTADGNETIDFEIEQPLCTNEYEAQRKAEFILRQSRNQITIVGKVGPKLMKTDMWATGTVNWGELGWTDKTFRCVGYEYQPDGSVVVALTEEQDDDWDDLAAGDYNSPSTAALPAINETTPTIPVNLSVANEINGTLGFSFGYPVVNPAGTRYRIIRSTNSANAAVGTVVWDGDTNKANIAMPASQHWYYAQAYVGSNYSAYSPNTYGVFGYARYSVPDMLRIVPDPDISLSTALGSYWSGNASVFSLSGTGGIKDGRIIVAVTSLGGGGHFRLVSMPSTPYPTWAAGYQVGVGFRVRRTATMSWSTAVASVFQPSIYITAWNGVSTPAPQEIGGGGNCRSFPNSTCYFNLPEISSLALNQWFDYQRTMVLDWSLTTSTQYFAHPNSYPYLVYVIEAPGVPDGRAGGYEFDFAGTFQ